MNALQVKWAQKHDWFNRAFWKNGKLCVEVIEPTEDNPRAKAIFTDYQKLRIWAGY